MRTTASDENVILEPPRQITLEYALEYIEEDELIEVTPKTIRLRKRVLDGERSEEGRPGRPGGGRVLSMPGSHSSDGGGHHHVGLGDVGGGPRLELRRKFDDDEDEFEDDGFTFDDDEDDDEDLDDEEDLDDDDDFDDEDLEEFEELEEEEEQELRRCARERGRCTSALRRRRPAGLCSRPRKGL